MALTARAIESAKGRERPYKLTDAGGLYLYVTPAGGKSWRANYRDAGRQKTRTYGLWPAVSLAEARRLHALARDEAEPEAPKAVATFEEVARRWLLKTQPGLSNPKHRQQVEATLERFAYPVVGSRPIDAITRAELVKAVEGVGTKTETAHRVAGRITAVFDFAIDAGIIDRHPASHLTRVLAPRRTQRPMPSIHPDEAGALMRAVSGYPEPVTRLGLLLAANTFVRVGELLGMRWSEIRGDVWVIPAERMKRRLPHVVPLSPPVLELLERLREMSGAELVLESPAKPGHPLSENTLLFALYRLGYRSRMTVHGFRALASTVLNESGLFARDAIERQLAHQESDDVRAAYHRAEYLEQRRQMMAWWSQWLAAAAECQPPASA